MRLRELAHVEERAFQPELRVIKMRVHAVPALVDIREWLTDRVLHARLNGTQFRAHLVQLLAHKNARVKFEAQRLNELQLVANAVRFRGRMRQLAEKGGKTRLFVAQESGHFLQESVEVSELKMITFILFFFNLAYYKYI